MTTGSSLVRRSSRIVFPIKYLKYLQVSPGSRCAAYESRTSKFKQQNLSVMRFLSFQRKQSINLMFRAVVSFWKCQAVSTQRIARWTGLSVQPAKHRSVGLRRVSELLAFGGCQYLCAQRFVDHIFDELHLQLLRIHREYLENL